MSTTGGAAKKAKKKAPSAAQKAQRAKFAKIIKNEITPRVEKLKKKHPKKSHAELTKMAWAEYKKAK